MKIWMFNAAVAAALVYLVAYDQIPGANTGVKISTAPALSAKTSVPESSTQPQLTPLPVVEVTERPKHVAPRPRAVPDREPASIAKRVVESQQNKLRQYPVAPRRTLAPAPFDGKAEVETQQTRAEPRRSQKRVPQKRVLGEGETLMSAATRRRELMGLAEDMELLFAKKTTR
ncbi:MAG: hypothetical protein HOL85_09065 [Rhodospirillaceae bacterium]|jgi:hypothetical protein|nr:hypothetical protein [Rhodospirillaceae bacterium]